MSKRRSMAGIVPALILSLLLLFFNTACGGIKIVTSTTKAGTTTATTKAGTTTTTKAGTTTATTKAGTTATAKATTKAGATTTNPKASTTTATTKANSTTALAWPVDKAAKPLPIFAGGRVTGVFNSDNLCQISVSNVEATGFAQYMDQVMGAGFTDLQKSEKTATYEFYELYAVDNTSVVRLNYTPGTKVMTVERQVYG